MGIEGVEERIKRIMEEDRKRRNQGNQAKSLVIGKTDLVRQRPFIQDQCVYQSCVLTALLYSSENVDYILPSCQNLGKISPKMPQVYLKHQVAVFYMTEFFCNQ